MTPAKIHLAYGRHGLVIDLPDDRVTVIEPAHAAGLPDERASMIAALRQPIGAPPLRESVKATDRVCVKLWVSSDAPDTDFFARLCDVYPDGRSINICEGQLRARFRDGFDREKPLRPGEVYALDLDLWSTSIIFNRGHCLRVDVTSSNSPGYDPNPNTGDAFRARDYHRAARNVVFVDRQHPSHIVLPVTAGK